MKDGLLDADVGYFFKIDEQFICLIEQNVLFGDLFQAFCFPDVLVYIIFESFNSIILFLPAGDVQLSEFKAFLDALFIPEVFYGLYIGALFFSSHHRKHLNVLDIFQVVDSCFGYVKNIEVLIARKKLMMLLVLEFYYCRPI